jgi:TonB family protein
MSVAAEMTPDWKSWEGDLVDGDFPLEQFLGAGEKSGTFRTRLPSPDSAIKDAAIKLVPAGGAQAERLLERWSQASALLHPNLIKIVRTGTWEKGGLPLAYVVTELAEENLGDVLAERALTAEETIEVLLPAADVLAYLHERGLVHGSLKPSNVFAVDDVLKLSSDALTVGDASADIRAAASMAVQALTQQSLTFLPGDAELDVIKSLPKPFQEIVRNCIGNARVDNDRVGDNKRLPWSAARLATSLRLQKPVPPPAPAASAPVSPSPKPRLIPASYGVILVLIVVAVIAVGSWLRNRPSAPVASAPPTAAKPVEPAQPAQASPPSLAPHKEPPVAAKPPAPREPPREAPREQKPRRVLADAQQDVLSQVTPDIPAPARRTINGTATVVIKVSVNPSGDVTDATMEPGGSRYFGKLAVEAARKWHFVPDSAAAPREWSLRFALTRTETTIRVEKLAAR